MVDFLFPFFLQTEELSIFLGICNIIEFIICLSSLGDPNRYLNIIIRLPSKIFEMGNPYVTLSMDMLSFTIAHSCSIKVVIFWICTFTVHLYEHLLYYFIYIFMSATLFFQLLFQISKCTQCTQSRKKLYRNTHIHITQI